MTRPSASRRLRTLLTLAAVPALLLGAARATILRPHPTESEEYSAFRIVYWSDDTVTSDHGTVPSSWRDLGPLVLVDWPDGSTTFHLRWTAR